MRASHRAQHLSLAFSLALTLFWQLFREESCMCGLSLIILLATFCIFPSFLTPSVLTYKANKRLGERQRETRKKKKLASSRCCIFKFFTALKTRNNKATERCFKWNFIMPRRCHNESCRPLNIFSHLFLVFFWSGGASANSRRTHPPSDPG